MEKQFEKFMQMRTQRAAVSYELEKEKHVLRQMQGAPPSVLRRYCWVGGGAIHVYVQAEPRLRARARTTRARQRLELKQSLDTCVNMASGLWPLQVFPVFMVRMISTSLLSKYSGQAFSQRLSPNVIALESVSCV